MEADTKQVETIDEYIEMFPENVQNTLQKIRRVIRESAPRAEEVISYQMPAFKLNRILVYFAAHRQHIGFYPTSSAIKEFKKELVPYEWGTGSVKFYMDKPIPFDLIKRMVQFRVQENLGKIK